MEMEAVWDAEPGSVEKPPSWGGWGGDELGDWHRHIYTIDAMHKIDN